MVSNVVVSAITATTATITWTTASSVSSEVQYGLTTSYGGDESGGTGTSHSATITGRNSNTTYHFRIGDASYGYTGDFTFTTLSMISNVVVSSITATTATITWTTASSVSSDLQYGTTTSYGSSQSGGSGTSHSVTITGLLSNTTYHFRMGRSSYGYSGDLTFTTLGIAISNLVVHYEYSDEIRITWTTSAAGTSIVEYGTTTSYGNTETSSSGTSHSVWLEDLSINVIYHYRVRSVSSSNPSDSVSSADATFWLGPDNIAVSSITASSATITWTTQYDDDSKVRYGLTTSYGENEYGDDDGTSHSVTLTGLSSNTMYHFKVGSNDGYSVDHVFSTLTLSISNVVVSVSPSGSVTITWNTDGPGNSVVDYGQPRRTPI